MNIPTKDQIATAKNDVDKKYWSLANKMYIRKSIAELMHEKLLVPKELSQKNGIHSFILSADRPGIKYRFRAEPRVLDYWFVHIDSIAREENGKQMPADDAASFYLDFQKQLGVDSFTMAHFLEETYKTLYADCFIYSKGRRSAHELADSDFQTLEHSQDGHPWYVFNKGRIGFNTEDYHRYAPEAGQLVQLSWLAVHNTIATFSGAGGLHYQTVIKNELGTAAIDSFNKKLEEEEVNPKDYFFIPFHEWQWNNKLAYFYAGEMAEKKVVLLGKGEDHYSPQQSIRTFFNVDNPDKFYVKVALSILNTSIYRGVSPKKLKVAPMISDWIMNLLKGDGYLKKCGFEALGEVATIACDHPQFSKIQKAPYQYYDFLGVIWRESAVSRLNEGEKLMTMAALMYVDNEGNTLIGALIKKSGLSPEQWLTKYMEAYLKPLLHCFYKHGLCFTPHGENTVLVLKDYIPQRIIMKDFVEEVHLNEEVHAAADEKVREVVWKYSNSFFPLFIVSGIFDAVFRYISNILVTYEKLDEDLFWKLVHKTIMNYQLEFPELKESYEKFDIYMPEFTRACINRIRLLTYGYKDGIDFPPIDTHGVLENPIFKFMNA